MTVDQLIDELQRESRADRGGWNVLIRIQLANDALIGSKISEVKVDGFHQTISLIGPEDLPAPQPVYNRCHKLQVAVQQAGWTVQRCLKDFGHEGRHKFQGRCSPTDPKGQKESLVGGPFGTFEEMDAWMKEHQ